MSIAFQSFKEVRFFSGLNGLRFLCILMVVWHHSPAHGSLGETWRILGRGFAGVDFFFVLSGFLITTLLLREEDRFGRFSLRGFYIRRILRIVPIYFLVVTAVAGYYVLVKGRADLAPLVPYYYLFLSNFLIDDIPLLSITWSLAVEEQYYLIWPALLLFLPIKGAWRPIVLIVLIAGCVLLAAEAWGEMQGIRTAHAIFIPPVTSYSAILIGSLLALVLHSQRGFAVLHALLGFRWAPVVTIVAVGLALHFTPGILTGWPNLIVHGAMAAALASIVLREDTVLHRVLVWRPVARVGEISYGVYLYHLIGLHIANEMGRAFDLGAWSITGLMIVFTLIISEISFRWYESRFLALRHKFSAGSAAARSSAQRVSR